MSKDTSLRDQLLSELIPGQTISPGFRAYFGQRLRNRVFKLVLSRFAEAQAAGLTKAELARRIGKRPEVVGRLLSSPGNWTLETASDLLLGISAEEMVVEPMAVESRPPANFSPEALLQDRAEWALQKQRFAQQQQQSNSFSPRVLGSEQTQRAPLTSLQTWKSEQNLGTHIDTLRSVD